MTQIVNNDKLNLILTDYALKRIAEVTENPTATIRITKIRLGNGRNEEYYEPSPLQESLEGDLGLEFYIYNKDLLEDGATVSFHTIIPETVGNFDIREIGLYETTDANEDKLFAISTQQPFVKPSSEDYYFMYIDYYMFIKSVNFAEHYDQIVIDINHAMVTEPDLEEMMRTFLFAQGNLVDQIGNNSRIIGYNRATQLYERLTENRKDFSYLATYKNYASLLDVLESPSNVFSYWIFDYLNRNSFENSIIDLSNNGYYLSSNKSLAEYTRVYNGLMSTLTFSTPNYFTLSSQFLLNLYDEETQTDSPFTMIFALEPLEQDTTRTLLAKSNYSSGGHSFEVQELSNNSLRVRLFSDASNYVTYTSAPDTIPFSPHVVIITYDPQTQKMMAFINSKKYQLNKKETGNYTHINEIPGKLYAFSCAPEYNIYTDEPSYPTELLNPDGSPYTGTDWRLGIEDNKVYYKGEEAFYDSEGNEITDKMYAWVPADSPVYDFVVYTKTEQLKYDTILYNSDYTEVDQTQSPFTLALSGDSYVILFEGGQTDRHPSYDIEPKTIYDYKYIMSDQIIYTNSTTVPTVLYNEDKSYYTGTDWVIRNNAIFYLGFRAFPDEDRNIETFCPNLSSYITNAQGDIIENINSNVGLVSIVKEKIPNDYARNLALILCANLGKNPYLGEL